MKIPKDFMEQAIKNVLEEYGLTEDVSLKDCVEKQIEKKPRFIMNRSDTVSVWECVCGKPFKTKHNLGVLDGTDVNYCKYCGQKLDWSDE